MWCDAVPKLEKTISISLILAILPILAQVKLRAPTLHTKPTSLRLYRDGRIRYSTRWLHWHSMLFVKTLIIARVNYDVACAMDFHFYPHDVQTCHVRWTLERHVGVYSKFWPSPLHPGLRALATTTKTCCLSGWRRGPLAAATSTTSAWLSSTSSADWWWYPPQ